MNRLIYISYWILCLFLFGKAEAAEIAVAVRAPRCELLVNPEGIGTNRPQLSWEIQAELRNVLQEAYQIQVASTRDLLLNGTADLWDSGKQESDQNAYIGYGGKKLQSRDECFWRVRVWTNKGESTWSEVQHWSVGLLNYVDWKGRWIGLDRAFPWDRETTFSRLSARYFRKEFKTEKQIKAAKAYVMGMGLYELYINGQKIGDQVLAPAPTDYTKEVKYNTFDVTSQVQHGGNTVGLILGNGRFYAMRQAYKPYKIKTFGYPKLRLNLEITYEDGSRETVVSDDSWKVTADGPIRANNEYDGEEYDATKELPGWNKSGFNDQQWLQAEFVQEPGGMPTAQMNEFMRVMDTLKVKSIKKLLDGKYILDLGQNMTGWLKLSVSGNKGQQVKLRFAESLQPDGNLYVANLRDAKVTDVYTLKGEGRESWQPRFVYHGFRYVELSGFPGEPKIDDFEGLVVYDGLETIGQFESSLPLLNQLYHNAYWGIAGNYKGMPLDCPQRNERQPWLGDRTTGAYGESFLFDQSKLYAKLMDDIAGAQTADGGIPDVAPAFWRYYGDNVTWPATYFTVGEMLYRQFGNKEPIVKHYASMKKWIDYMAERYLEEGLMTKDKYGDWCVPPESKELIHSQDPARQTDGTLIASATYYHLLDLMRQFAVLSDRESDIPAFKKLQKVLLTAFNTRFFDREKHAYGNNTVTANLLPLSFGMVPAEWQDTIFQRIVHKVSVEDQGHLSTGVIGTQWIMRGLSERGRPDLAYQLATQVTYPSWGYMIEHGATTIWELWNGDTANPQMNSQNHVMLLGDLLIWYYEHLAGIKALSPGFKRIQMRPDTTVPLTHVKASYHAINGEIGSFWKKEKGQWSWEIKIPVNSVAEVALPAKGKIYEGKALIDQVEGVRYLRTEGTFRIYEIGSGSYALHIEN